MVVIQTEQKKKFATRVLEIVFVVKVIVTIDVMQVLQDGGHILKLNVANVMKKVQLLPYVMYLGIVIVFKDFLVEHATNVALGILISQSVNHVIVIHREVLEFLVIMREHAIANLILMESIVINAWKHFIIFHFVKVK